MTTDTLTLSEFVEWMIATEVDGRARVLRDLAEAMRHRGDELVADFLEQESARVLATCKAHRAIVELHGRSPSLYSHKNHCETCTQRDYESDDDWPCLTLRALASIWADREAFRAEWAL